jgi:hypothetical protein
MLLTQPRTTLPSLVHYPPHAHVPTVARSPQASGSVLGAVLKFAGWTAAAIVAYKFIQAITDTDFGRGEFPASFRQGLIEDHIDTYGSKCPACQRSVRRSQFTVDHIVALANGGRTSRANARVVCASCNSRKGARNSILDYLRGR